MVSPKDRQPGARNFYQRNFVKALEVLTPGFYVEEELEASGVQIDPISQLLNSHMKIAEQTVNLFNVSATLNISAINNVSGFSSYFIPQNNLTDISPLDFERNILNPLDFSLNEFNTSAEFKDFLETTLIPKIHIGRQGMGGDDSLLNQTDSKYAETASGTHEYLVKHLSWFYFLTTSGLGGLSYDPSTIVRDRLADTLYSGKTLQLNDGLKALGEHVWRNYETCASIFSGMVPVDYISGVDSSTIYTSGTQLLDRLNTLTDILYKPTHMGDRDTFVKDSFNDFITLDLKLTETESKGPFFRFLRSMGFQLADFSETTNTLGLIYDIERTDEKFLPLLAELIGWRFFGHDPSRWRLQLRNAVDVYKRVGTRAAIQFAVNSVVDRGSFDVSSQMSDMWESYVPFLIYYSLATESPAFRSFDVWTEEIATQMGIFSYSTSSMDENIRTAVDHIILRLVEQFPDHFHVGKKEFPLHFDKWVTPEGVEVTTENTHLHADGTRWEGKEHTGLSSEDPVVAIGDPNFTFKYRNRVFPIPPFEVYKYYKDAHLTPNMIDGIVRWLKCFGVRNLFAEQVGHYIRRFTTQSQDEFYIGNNEWLFFTETQQTAPNFTEILDNIGNDTYGSSKRRDDFLPMWNSKSSHMKILFQASSFDFTTETLSSSGAEAMINASKSIREFLPAHAIPDLFLLTAGEDTQETEATFCPDVRLDQSDTWGLIGRGSASGQDIGAGMNRYGISGVDMRSLFPNRDFGRAHTDGNDDCSGGFKEFNHPVDYLLSSTGVISAPRNTQRRRNFKHVLPRGGWYDRTGLNMPIVGDASAQELSIASSQGFIPLGWVPASGGFQAADVVSALHAVWDECETTDSSSVFFGYDVSHTYPCRGTHKINSNVKYENEEWTASTCDHYVARDQLPPIIRAMHSLGERRKVKQAQNILDLLSGDKDLSAQYSCSTSWRDIPTSYANSATIQENENWFPSSIDDYKDYKFDQGIHRLYRDYASIFAKHHLRAAIVCQDGGANIFSHTYGPGVYNGTLDVNGSAVTTSPDLVASSVSSVDKVANLGGEGILSYKGVSSTASGTYVASSNINMPIPVDGAIPASSLRKFEFRNANILSGIEFVITSSVSGTGLNASAGHNSNGFEIYKIAPVYGQPNGQNYLINNTVVKCKAIDGFPRMRFDMPAYGLEWDAKNKILKDCVHEFRVNALVSNEVGNKLGGGTLGVWIHTGNENGKIWSWTRNNRWELDDYDSLTIDRVLNNLSHSHSFGVRDYPGTTLELNVSSDACVPELLLGRVEDNTSAIQKIREEYFEEFLIPFNTRNQPIAVPESYYGHKPHPNFLGVSAIDMGSYFDEGNAGAFAQADKDVPFPLCGPLSSVWESDDNSLLLAQSRSFRVSSLDSEVCDYTLSIYLQQGTATKSGIQLSFTPNDSVYTQASIDWSTSTITDTDSQGGGIHQSRLDAIPNTDWHRLSVTTTNVSGDAGAYITVYPGSHSDNNVTGTVFAFGPKLEKGSLDDPVPAPFEYPAANAQQVHRDDQRYIIEVFMYPNRSNVDKFMLVDNVDLLNVTLNRRSSLPFTKYDRSEKYRSPRQIPCSSIADVPLLPEELRDILKYFNSLTDGSQSRNASNSESEHDTSGGSRLNYREHATWSPHVLDGAATGTEDFFESLEVIN